MRLARLGRKRLDECSRLGVARRGFSLKITTCDGALICEHAAYTATHQTACNLDVPRVLGMQYRPRHLGPRRALVFSY